MFVAAEPRDRASAVLHGVAPLLREQRRLFYA